MNKPLFRREGSSLYIAADAFGVGFLLVLHAPAACRSRVERDRYGVTLYRSRVTAYAGKIAQVAR